MTTNNDKLAKVVIDLLIEGSESEDERPIINRQKLRQSIYRALECSSVLTVYAMIDRLLTLGLITNNPTSQLSAQKHKTMPTNDTRYFIERQNCREFLKAQQKTAIYTYTTLDQFERANSHEHQKENKAKIPLSTKPQ